MRQSGASRIRRFLFGAALAIGCATAAVAVEPGVAGVFFLDEITVVYPSADAPQVESRNRASAELRAGFLRHRHGISTRVVADKAVRPDDVDGHLLVLGWENRLFDREPASRPFRRSETSLAWGGALYRRGGLDLAFMANSPFAANKRMAFWSRIDPEFDRFQPLPSEGSSWVLYDGTRVVAQGMWDAERLEWPPKRDANAERDRRAEFDRWASTLGKRPFGRYDVVYDPAAVPEDTIEELGRVRAAALDRAIRAFGPVDPEFRATLRLYPNDDDKRDRTSIPSPVHTLPREGEIHMTLEYARSDNPHEEYHLVARATLGPTYSTAMYEGLAIDRLDEYDGFPIDLHGARLERDGRFPDLATLLDETDFPSVPNAIAFPASALWTRWLREAHPGKYAAVYAMERPSLARAADRLGMAPVLVERNFHAWLRERSSALAARIEADDLLARAQELHFAGDFAGLVTVLEQVLERVPDDHQTRFNLASARLRTGDLEAAERDLRTILEAGLAPNHRLRVFGHYQLARLFDLAGKRQAALSQYRAMLALPDVFDSHLLAREGIETPFTAERLE